MRSRHYVFLALLVCLVLFVPWLGDTYFYTKGEPRVAIVATSILQSGDWILPVSQGTDIPYKPPLLAWCIALLASLLNGGVVNEFIARLPSALAASAMLAGTFAVVQRHSSDKLLAWLTMLICATSFEVFRAATACRVDMLLTACMVGAIYALYGMDRDRWRILWAVLLLSGAVLTKGPVGALLPCLCMGIYMLADGRNFFRTASILMAVCVTSFLLPAVWYYLAWKQGGDTFAQLAWEENIGRLTGTMSYDSHLNPWYYNVVSILAGFLPWTVPAITALCYRRVRRAIPQSLPRHGWPLLCLVCAAVVFLFYCIPASKRSVYLLPCYPFMSYGIAWALARLGRTKFMSGWCYFMGAAGVAAGAVFVLVNTGVLHIKGVIPVSPWLWGAALLPGIVCAYTLCTRRPRTLGLTTAVAFTYLLVLAYNAAYMPMALNARSDIGAARAIDSRVPAGAPIYGVVPQDSLLRYYSINFYLGDRLRHCRYPGDAPDDAWIICSEADPTRPAPDTLSRRGADTRRPILLMAPRQLP